MQINFSILIIAYEYCNLNRTFFKLLFIDYSLLMGRQKRHSTELHWEHANRIKKQQFQNRLMFSNTSVRTDLFLEDVL